MTVVCLVTDGQLQVGTATIADMDSVAFREKLVDARGFFSSTEIMEKGLQAAKGLASATSLVVQVAAPMALESVPFGHVAAALLGAAIRHGEDLKAFESHKDSIEANYQGIVSVLVNLADARFPQDTPAFNGVLASLASIRDTLRKWSGYSWMKKLVGMSISQGTSLVTKHKATLDNRFDEIYKRLSELQVCGVARTLKRPMRFRTSFDLARSELHKTFGARRLSLRASISTWHVWRMPSAPCRSPSTNSPQR